MWTKHLSVDGQQHFYFNAATNISSWKPPKDAIIHEAPNIKPPPSSSSSSSSAANLQSTAPGVAQTQPEQEQEQQKQSIPAASNSAITMTPNLDQFAAITDDLKSIQDRLNDATAAAVRKQQMLSASKRQKQTTAVTDTTASAYLQQKSEIEAFAGNQDEDGGKWYVR
jgi:hypothetical protein